MNESQQAELLEQYLALLRSNPQAVPPPGLDPETAAFARKLVSRPASNPALKARVWQRALTAAQGEDARRMRHNGHRTDPIMPLEEHPSMIASHVLPARKSTPWFTLIAAAIAVSVFGFYLFNLHPEPPPRDPGAAAAQQASSTPSAVPSATLIPQASVTPTPAPANADMAPTLVPGSGEVLPTLVPMGDVAYGTGWQPFVLNAARAVRIDLGSAVSGQLSAASPVAGYTFTAPNDGPVTVTVVTDQFQPLIAYGTAGSPSAISAAAGGALPLTLQSGENVTFNVTSVNGSGTGPYIVRLQAGPPDDGSVIHKEQMDQKEQGAAVSVPVPVDQLPTIVPGGPGKMFTVPVDPKDLVGVPRPDGTLDGVIITSAEGGQTDMMYVTGQIVSEPGQAPYLKAQAIPGYALPASPSFTIVQPAQGPVSLSFAGQAGQPTIVQSVDAVTVPGQANELYTVQDGNVMIMPVKPGEPNPADQRAVPPGFDLKPDAFSDLSQAQDITPGQPVDGTLSAEQPAALYHFVAQTSGLLNMHVDSAANDLFLAIMINQQKDAPDAAATAEATAEATGEAGQTARDEKSSSLMVVGAMASVKAAGGLPQHADPAPYVEAGSDVYIRVGGMLGPSASTFKLLTNLAEPKAIALGDSVEADLNDSAPSALYSFEATAGDVISASVEGSDGFDTQLAFGSIAGAPQVGDDDSGSGFNPELSGIVIPETGTYYLTVQPYNGAYGASGHFTLRVERQAAPSLDSGAQTVAFNTKQQPSLTFTGKAGETVQLVVRVPADATAYSVEAASVRVEQNGSAIGIFDRGGDTPAVSGSKGGVTLLSGPVTIPADGVVTVRLNAVGTLNDSDSLRLEVAVER